MRGFKNLPFYTWYAFILPSLDALTFLGWGILLLGYWWNGQIKLLIHPNYIWLVILTGFILLLIGIGKSIELYKERKKIYLNNRKKVVQHITLFPSGWNTAFLLITLILATFISPKALDSEVALKRGIRETLPLTQAQPEPFRVDVKAEDRSLIDWVKTLNSYPEPESYQGEVVNVRGFVIKMDELDDHYFLLAQFIITCCALDAYPIALPVKIEESNEAYAEDSWLEIKGEMITDMLPLEGGQYQDGTLNRQLTIQAETITKIPTPDDPYGY
ncbi:MAG: TIGR03943 family putative permease subunit [Halothece sp.]